MSDYYSCVAEMTHSFTLLTADTDLDALLPLAPLSADAQTIVDGIKYGWERRYLAWLADQGERVSCTRSGFMNISGEPELKDWQARRVRSWGVFGSMDVEYTTDWAPQDMMAAPETGRWLLVTELGQEVAAEFAA